YVMKVRRQVKRGWLAKAGRARRLLPPGHEDAPAGFRLAAEVQLAPACRQPRVQFVRVRGDGVKWRRRRERRRAILLDGYVNIEVLGLLVLLGGEVEILRKAVVGGHENAAIIYLALNVIADRLALQPRLALVDAARHDDVELLVGIRCVIKRQPATA